MYVIGENWLLFLVCVQSKQLQLHSWEIMTISTQFEGASNSSIVLSNYSAEKFKCSSEVRKKGPLAVWREDNLHWEHAYLIFYPSKF